MEGNTHYGNSGNPNNSFCDFWNALKLKIIASDEKDQ